ncbi:hypothetical protein Tco_1427012, partial [Tanacetum coccineum]
FLIGSAKGEPSVQRDPLFDKIPEDTLDHTETEDAQDVGRTRDIVGEEKENDENVLSTKDVLSTDKEKVSTDKEKVSTDKEKVNTDRPIVSTDGSKVSTDRQIEDDETIAKVLLNTSQAKAVSREKEKGVELKDIEETDRPRPTSTRSLLTLKSLPIIDPKDKGKKKIKEDDETESESDGIPEAEKKFKQLASDEEMARKIQEEREESVSKQRRKFAKGESSVQRDPLFDEIPEDTIDHMETENAQDVGRTRELVGEENENDENVLSTEDVLSTDKEKVSTDKEKVSTDRPIVSTDRSKVSTDRQIEGTDEQIEGTDEQSKGTDDHTEEGSVTQTTQTPTSTIFGDDETIAKVLLNMSQAKAVSREKEKGPLPIIDPKDKGKKKIEEDDETESESDGIPKAEKKFKQLACDEEMARKIQEEWEGEEERSRLAEEKATNEALIRIYDDIKARIEADRLLAEKLQEEESNRKRKLGTRKKMKLRKRRFIQNTSEDDSEKENDELRLYLTIALDEEKEVDYEILDRKYPIKEWKTECLGTKPQVDKAEHLEEINQNVVIRSNGQKRYFNTLMRVLSIFDRDYLTAVYQLVMDRYQDEIPEGFDRVIWGDLMVMFNPDDEDKFWNSQQDWNIYPVRKKVLLQMLELKLESEEDSTMAFELIRFVKKQIAELEPEDFDGDEKDL